MRTCRPPQALHSTGGCGRRGRRRQPPPPGEAPASADAAFRGPSGAASAPLGGRGRAREGRPDVVALRGGSPGASLRGWGVTPQIPRRALRACGALSRGWTDTLAGRQGHRAEASGTPSQLAGRSPVEEPGRGGVRALTSPGHATASPQPSVDVCSESPRRPPPLVEKRRPPARPGASTPRLSRTFPGSSWTGG